MKPLLSWQLTKKERNLQGNQCTWAKRNAWDCSMSTGSTLNVE